MKEKVKLVRDVAWCDQQGFCAAGRTTEVVEVEIDWLGNKPDPKNYNYVVIGEWRIAEERGSDGQR